jgi:hypothetical protein
MTDLPGFDGKATLALGQNLAGLAIEKHGTNSKFMAAH